jgi:hypothetical protein
MSRRDPSPAPIRQQLKVCRNVAARPSSVVRFAMKRPGRRKQRRQSNAARYRRHGEHWTTGLIALAMISFGGANGRAADATSPVDYTQRNAPFAPVAGATVVPEKQTPATNPSVQDKRFEQTTLEKKTAPQAERRAGVEVKEEREKQVWEKKSHRPETREQPTSAFNHRPAAIATSTDTSKPPLVARYQDSLAAASVTNMARFPALDRATTAKINRFVFRKNPPDASATAAGKTVIPAGGSPAIPVGPSGITPSK